LRIAAHLNRVTMLPLRFAELVSQRLFMRQPIVAIHKPPPVNPAKPKPRFSPNQLAFVYG